YSVEKLRYRTTCYYPLPKSPYFWPFPSCVLLRKRLRHLLHHEPDHIILQSLIKTPRRYACSLGTRRTGLIKKCSGALLQTHHSGTMTGSTWTILNFVKPLNMDG